VEVLRRRGDLVIARTKHGFICANAGVDRSNAAPGTAVLLPHDPDRSAHGIRMALRAATGVDLAVIISDTFGRPWRRGLTDVAIGVSGMLPILDLRDLDAAGGAVRHRGGSHRRSPPLTWSWARRCGAGGPGACVEFEGECADMVR
jgi:F420-0:gamma-glutamyl ligase